MSTSIARTELSAWWLLFCAAFLSVALGTWGTQLYLAALSKPAPIADCFYRAIQLFTFNLNDPGPFPWQLEVARWMAPAITLVSLGTAFSGVLQGHYLVWRLSKLRNHTVLVGSNWSTHLHTDDAGPIVFVQTDGDTQPFFVVNSNIGFTARTIEEAVTRCAMYRSAMIAVEVNSLADGISWMNASYDICLQHGKLARNLCLVSKELTTTAGLIALSQLAEPQLRVRVIDFNHLLFEQCASWVAETIGAGSAIQSANIIRLAGDVNYSLEIARQIAKQLSLLPDIRLHVDICTSANKTGQERTLKDSDLQALNEAAPHMNFRQMSLDLSDASALDCTSTSMLIYSSSKADELLQNYAALNRIVQTNNHLKLAVTVHGSWAESKAIASLLGNATQSNLTLISGVTGQEFFNTIIGNSTLERLARDVHSSYLTTVQDFAAPASKPWDALQERYRDSSRLQVHSFVFKLAGLGYTLDAAMTNIKTLQAEIELKIEDLAEAEHNRWSAEKKLQGWTYGAIRDDAAKLHPCLVGYAALPEVEKEKDRVMWHQLIKFVQTSKQQSATHLTAQSL